MNFDEIAKLQSSLRVLQNMALPSQQVVQMAHSAQAMADLYRTPALEAMQRTDMLMCNSARAVDAVNHKYEQLNRIANASYEASEKMLRVYNSPIFKNYGTIQNFINFYEINPAIHALMNFAGTHQNFIEHFYNQNIWEFTNSFKVFRSVPFTEHTTFIENVLFASSEFSQEERNLILENAGNSLQKPNINFELSDKILALLKEFFPAFFLKDFDAKAAKATIISITAILAFLIESCLSVQAHNDSIQAHNDAVIEQKQNDEKIKLLKEISDQNKELLKIHKETANRLKNGS